MQITDNERYQLLSTVIKAFSHPLRIQVVELLEKSSQKVGDIAEETGVEISVISRHLSILAKAGIVDGKRKGKEIFYSLLIPCANQFFHCVENVLNERTAIEVRRVQKTTGCGCFCDR